MASGIGMGLAWGNEWCLYPIGRVESSGRLQGRAARCTAREQDHVVEGLNSGPEEDDRPLPFRHRQQAPGTHAARRGPTYRSTLLSDVFLRSRRNASVRCSLLTTAAVSVWGKSIMWLPGLGSPQWLSGRDSCAELHVGATLFVP